MNEQNLIKDFRKLKKPKKASIYNILKIGGKHKLGKNSYGNPVILIPLNKKYEFSPNIQLKNMTVLFNILCKTHYRGEKSEANYVIIELTGSDVSLINPFLRISLLIISLLGENPNRKDITQIVGKFISLFKAINLPPRKTIQGLWAELFLIDSSKNHSSFVDAWHANPIERYDFNFKKFRLEVKSTTNRERIHNFSYEQLNPPANIPLFIVSIFTEESSNGRSINDLMIRIEKKLSKKNKVKLRLIVLETIGNSEQDLPNMKFDTALAFESLKIFDHKKIPCVCRKHISDRIRDIKFKTDLSGIKECVSRISNLPK